MKLNTNGFRIKCRHPLLLALGSLPLIWLLLCRVAPHLFFRGTLLLGLTVLLTWGCMLLPGKLRLGAGCAGSAALLFAGVVLLPLTEGGILLIVPVLCAVLLMGSLPFAGWPPAQEMPMGWQMAAIATHALAQLILFFTKEMQPPPYAAIQAPLVFSFLACSALVLLAMNRSSLDSAAQSRYTVPLPMRRQNVFITLAMLAIGVGIAAIPAIGRALETAWRWLKQGVTWLVGIIMRLLPDTTTGGSGAAPAGSMELGGAEAVQPSAFALLMEKVMLVVALVLLVVALALFARTVGKRLWRLIQRLWHRLGRYGLSASGDYEDEVTDTRDASVTEKESLRSRLRRFVPADEKDLTPTQQVRNRYRRLKRRHREWSPASTARETLPASAASLYEQARYSGQPLTAAEAEQFLKDTKKG